MGTQHTLTFLSHSSWRKKSTHHGHTVQSYILPKGSADSAEATIRNSLNLDPHEYWVGRTSTHQLEHANGASTYERFRAGLLVDHSEQERRYIESCIESERLQVFREREAEGESLRCLVCGWGLMVACSMAHDVQDAVSTTATAQAASRLTTSRSDLLPRLGHSYSSSSPANYKPRPAPAHS
jgi:hypothetical protein